EKLLFLTAHETITDLPLAASLSKLAVRSFDASQIFEGGPPVYAGALLILPFLLYFGAGRFPVRERLRTLILCLILLFSFSLSFLNRIWHAGSAPSGYRYRYSFLFSFLMILSSFEVLRRFSGREGDAGKVQGGREKEDLRSFSRIFPVLYSAILLLCFFILLFTGDFSYLDLKKKLITLALVTASGLMLLFLFLSEKRSGGRYSPLLLLCFSLILSGELYYSFSYTCRIQSGGQLSAPDFIKLNEDLALQTASLKDSPRSVCRYALPFQLSENDPLLGGFPGISVYTSVTPFSDRIFLKSLGFHDNCLYTEPGSFHTKSASLILSLNEDGDPLSMALSLPEGSSSKGPLPDHKRPDPYAYTEAYLSAYTGKSEKLFESASAVPLSENDTVVTYSVTPALDGRLSLYIRGAEEAGCSMTVTVNNEEPSIFGNAAFCGILDLGERKAGEVLAVTFRADNAAGSPVGEVLDGLLVMTENEDAVKSLRERLRPSEGTFYAVSSSRFTGTAPANGETLILTLPFDPGFSLRIGGRKVRTVPYAGEFLSAKIPEDLRGGGDLEFTLRYLPEGFVPGLFITAFGILLFAVLIIYERRSGHDPH
ncbi:MAG: YfhO family protein, partial [Lachnospiraceae bacterium]|nr:YfhO family protein [Lachnospiraceae bacterium]